MKSQSFCDEVKSIEDDILKSLDTLNLLEETFYSLGHLINSDVFERGKNLSMAYKDPEKLSSIDSKTFISSSNKFLVNFLEGVSSTRKYSLDSKSEFTLSMVIESIYHLRNRNYVLPHHFLCNLLQSSTSGSKCVSVVNGKCGPSGSYT